MAFTPGLMKKHACRCYGPMRRVKRFIVAIGSFRSVKVLLVVRGFHYIDFGISGFIANSCMVTTLISTNYSIE